MKVNKQVLRHFNLPPEQNKIKDEFNEIEN